MKPYGTRLKDHFQSELTALVEEAAVFAQSYPAEADALRLGSSGSTDPHVRMLMQSFAFLTGRVRHEMEQAKAHMANALLQHLQPQLALPLPSMMVAQMAVRPDTPPGAVLERGRQVQALATDGTGERRICKLRSTMSVPLLPLQVRAASLHAADAAQGGHAVLRIEVVRQGVASTASLGLERLRFYIDSTQRHAFYLYEQLAMRVCSVRLNGQVQPQCVVRWLGFDEASAALPALDHAQPGHRLLQEYFAFPEKFMFFDLGALDCKAVEGDFTLELLLDAPIDTERELPPNLLRLNCVPLVNLYAQRLDPMPLNHARFEYPLKADLANHRHCEVHSLEELVAIQSDGSLRELRPYFEMQDLLHERTGDYFYVLRHERSQLGDVAGTEAHLSFLDTAQQRVLPVAEVMAGRALCTNRRLPERLRPGQTMQLEGAGPVLDLTLVSKPSAHDAPVLTGQRPWTLVSALSLNHRSLANGPAALTALKQVLLAYVGPGGVQAVKHIDGLQGMGCRQVLRHRFHAGMRSFFHCLEVVLRVDRAAFEHSSAVLFASVLRHFMAQFAAVNTLVELSLECTSRREPLMSWPPLAGEQELV